MKRMVTNIYFSPSGTTAKVAKRITENITENMPGAGRDINLLTEKITSINFDSDSIVIVSMPVFAGRIPNVCIDMLHSLRGNNTPAIAAVVYGNRAYEDALLELTNMLRDNGFIVAGAGAFVAQHSIFNKVAHGRPDSLDMDKINEFSMRCRSVIERGNIGAISVPGNIPYREVSVPAIRPSGKSKCNQCGACVRICPVGAIPAADPRTTDKEKCINCTACIDICPRKARGYRGIKYTLGAGAFKKKCSARLEPEYYLADTL